MIPIKLICISLPIVLGMIILYFNPSILQYPSQLAALTSKSCAVEGKTIFTREELLSNDGRDPNKGLYLAFMGRVYDVEKGLKHYGPGGSYSHFAGRDGTRGFLTGDFTEDGLTDDISDLEVTSMSGVREWIQFYEREYPNIGVVIGSYYDPSGCETPKLHLVHRKFAEYDEMMKSKEKEEQQYPPCNSEWNEASGTTRLWCTTMSGGIQRDWSGVPRQIITSDGGDRCGCLNLQDESLGVQYADEQADSKGAPYKGGQAANSVQVKEYPGCDPKETQCLLYANQKP